MDWYQYIPSKDVRAHLRKIGYQFTQRQAAYIVWKNRNITLKERQTAWQAIINCYLDEPISARRIVEPRASFHAYLRDYMALQNGALKTFFKEEKNAVYRYRFYCEGDGDLWCENYGGVFSSYEKVREDIGRHFTLPIVKVEVKKSYVDDVFRHIIVTTDKEGEITDVDFSCASHKIMYEDDVFEGYWLDIPLPFRRGDVVIERGGRYARNEPFVLYSCHNWQAKDYEENGEKLTKEKADRIEERYKAHKENGDDTDTYPLGYALTGPFDNSGVDKLYLHVKDVDILSLELYDGEYQDDNRLLRLMSKRLKGEIDDELFAHGHFLITQESYIKNYKKTMYFTAKAWEDMGVEET